VRLRRSVLVDDAARDGRRREVDVEAKRSVIAGDGFQMFE